MTPSTTKPASEATEAPTPIATPGQQERGGDDSIDRVSKKVTRVDSIVCYEVTDDELAELKRGSPESIMLNLAVALAAYGLGMMPTFYSATYATEGSRTVFKCLTAVALLLSGVLFVLWAAYFRSKAGVVERIRTRGTTDSSKR